jgi:hypothetical protein
MTDNPLIRKWEEIHGKKETPKVIKAENAKVEIKPKVQYQFDPVIIDDLLQSRTLEEVLREVCLTQEERDYIDKLLVDAIYKKFDINP